MSTTEDRIVRMKFDNASFKKGALETKQSLDAIDASVAKAGDGRGLLDMGKHMDTVKVKASAMQVAVVTAIANIANRAVDAGITLAKSLTIDPVKQGFDEYELKMKSIQTILANTKGETLASVTKELDKLNEYSDKTIYNFANMTQNIGKMTTAGIDLQVATDVVKGFSNMVALAGGDATAAAGALEQFVYGLQAGKITALDWQSIATRGLGSQSLQKAFFETARAAGTLKDVPLTTTFEQWSKDVGGFKGSLESGWLTADVAQNALALMTGEIEDVQDLMAMGFDEKTARDMIDIAEKAEKSATEVRTLTAFLDTLQESVASGWSKVMETLFGDFDEATEGFTALSEAAGKVVDNFFDYVNTTLTAWDKLKGRAATLTAIQHILAPIGAILGRIGDLWKMAFPGGESGSALAKFSRALEVVTRPLNIFAKMIDGTLTPTEAFFRLLQVSKTITRGVAKAIGGIVEAALDIVGIKIPSGPGTFLGWLKEVAEAIGGAIREMDRIVRKGGSIRDAFGSVDLGLPKMPSFEMPSLPSMPDLPVLGGIFGGGEAPQVAGLAGGVQALTGSVKALTGEAEKLEDSPMFNPDADISGGRVRDLATGYEAAASSAEKAATVGEKAGPILEVLWEKLKGFIQNFSLDDLMASFNLAVLSTFMISISRFFNTLSDSFKGFVGTGEAVNGILESAGNALNSFQTQARAKLILNAAIAIGILAGALWVLSKIPADRLVYALGAISGIAIILRVTLGALTELVEKMDGAKISINMVALSVAIVALASAMVLLGLAFLIFERVDLTAVAKGLVTMVVTMKLLEGFGKLAEGAYKNLLAGAVAIGMIAGSMIVLAGALLLFKLVDWDSMGKAGASLAAIVLAVGLLALIPYEGISKVGVALLAASVGMLAIANALIIFGAVKWESIGKASVMLGVLTIALGALMYVGNPVTVSGVVAISAAMIGLALAALVLNKVDWSSIGKIGVIMLVLVAGFAAMLAIITVFAPALIILSGFAGSIALLALALTGLTLAVAAVLPILAAGTGMFAAFATGAAVAVGVFLQTLALQAPIMKNSILKILQSVIDGIVESVPMVIDGVKRLFQAIEDQFTKDEGPKAKALMGTEAKSWIEKIKDSIAEKIPLIVEKAKELMIRFIEGLVKHSKEIGQKGSELVIGLINGISSRIGGIVNAAVNLIIQFAAGITGGLNRIIDAGVQLIADFLHKLADTIRNGSRAIGAGLDDVIDAMKDVGVDMVKGMIGGLQSMLGDALGAIGDLAGSMVDKAKGAFEIFSPSRVFMRIGKFVVEGLTKGVRDNASAAISATAAMVGGQIATATQYIDKFIQDLDQKAIAASARAAGLERAAAKAAKAASNTKKNKKDDKSARKLQSQAEKAARIAERQELKAAEAKEARERADRFAESSLIEKAKMRSEDAQNQLDAAKFAEYNAAAKLEEARALREQAKAKGVKKKDSKAMRKQAEALEKQAEAQARESNAQLAAARQSAAEALALQKMAGEEAARRFQEQYDAEAKKDAEEEAFDKLSDAEKAAERRRQAHILQTQANADLEKAKVLAYTDLELANAMAEQAMEQADTARQYLVEAGDLEERVRQGTMTSEIDTGGTVVALNPTEAANLAFNSYDQLYRSAYAAAARSGTVQFNQYNTSPEALNDSEVYRRTNNQLAFAQDKLAPAS